MPSRNKPLHTLFALAGLWAAGALGASCIKDVGVTQCPDGMWCAPGYDCLDRNGDGEYECVSDTCGNGVQDGSEACDPGTPGQDSASCNYNCTLPVCGDEYVNAAAGEECDPGTPGLNTAECNSNCRIPACGDGHLNPVTGEVCDDGNNVAGDGCSPDCLSNESCGNGILELDEVCDDGNDVQEDD
jgi:cysteine-rich repeat protein